MSRDTAAYDEPVFGEPPATARKDRLQMVLMKVAATPMTWALVADYAMRASACETASRIRNAARYSLEGGRWEATTRGVEDGRWGLWVRWVPVSEETP